MALTRTKILRNSELPATAITTSTLRAVNRIINGAMEIDQRNAGASVTVNNLAIFYGVDRFRAIGQASAGVFTMQQVTDAPTGFTNNLKVTVTTADGSIAASDRYFVQQVIEGFNAADLGFGASGASTVSISFWVKSSLTGTFGACLQNDGPDRSYPFSYTINSANTWEQKTVTIAGDTSGTWLKNNTGWGRITWSIGSGSDYTSTANSWQAGNFEGVNGQTQIISTLNATWQITGVQLEAGSVATSFERRQYGQELALCQRYYTRLGGNTGNGYQGFCTAAAYGTNNARGVIHLPVSMRTAPTFAHVGNFEFLPGPGGTSVSSIGLADSGGNPNVALDFTSTSGFLVSAGGYEIRAANSSSAHFSFTAEL